MSFSIGYGILFAIISLLCNGSFSSLNKLPSVISSKINPQIFNLYFIFGTIISSIIVYAILIIDSQTVTFTYLGVISGFLLGLTGITTFASIKYIGLTVGVAIWSGSAVLISFIEGFLVNDIYLYSLLISIIGIIILLTGIIIVAFCELITSLCCPYQIFEPIPDALNYNITNNNNSQIQESQSLITPKNSNYTTSADYSLSKDTLDTSKHTIQRNDSLNRFQNRNNNGNDDIEDDSRTHWFLGIFYAILTGIIGGSVGLPSTWTDDTNSGAKYLISFAVGASFIFPITLLNECLCSNKKIKWNLNTCFIPGFVAGVIWNMGNLASLYAIESLGYSVAYTIMQSSLIIASIWGIVVWKEFTSSYVITFIVIGAVTVITGCVLITYGVDGYSMKT